jgi:pimeloyl-ACP methyl ester carboxylesterase
VEHMNRRAVVASLLAAPACATGVAHGADRVGLRDQALAALQPYTGVYELSPDHRLGIDGFTTDAGETTLLFCDYRTSVVRPLFRVSQDEFAMGPSFAVRTPVQQTVQFQKDSRGVFRGLTLGSQPGRSNLATRIKAQEDEVVFRCGEVSLAGTFTLPAGPGPHPAIILLHGSGPLTRTSFGPYRRFFNSLGFAVLVYDKRGTGTSTGTRFDASTGAPTTLSPRYYPDDLIDDALAALQFLQGRKQVDQKRIGFWGSSEGGMVATQVAARSKVAFAIDSSGFMGPLWQTLLYQAGAILKTNGRPQADIEQVMAFTRLWMDVARTGNGYSEFLSRRQEIIDSGKPWLLSYTSRDFTSLAQMRWAWDHILAFSPLPALRNVTCPVLGLFGEADHLTEVSKASSAMRTALAEGGNGDVTVKIFPNAGHSLMETPSRIGIAPGVFDTLRQWLLARGMQPRPGVRG